MDDDDDYDEMFGGLYEDGHWEWNDIMGSLVFLSDLPSEHDAPAAQVILTSVDFKDDLDLLEQALQYANNLWVMSVVLCRDEIGRSLTATIVEKNDTYHPANELAGKDLEKDFKCRDEIGRSLTATIVEKNDTYHPANELAGSLLQRFRKRFQRKTSSDDVVMLQKEDSLGPCAEYRTRSLVSSGGKNITYSCISVTLLLQDIKDVVLFTAPKAIVTPSLVKILHLPMTDRLMRALIIYCQYYLQVSDDMSKRILELQTKIRTPKSDETELKFRENLEDLRLLVAKEYCAMIMGAEDFAKYHHMGPKKKSRSLSKKEAFLFESILRIAMQIVWLALGRKYHNQLELEIHRVFKSEIYNIIEHKLKVKCRDILDPSEVFVMFGHCLKHGRLTNSYSPLMSEIQCDRETDYRLMGLGVIEYKCLNSRLRFFERVLTAPEKSLKTLSGGISIGILGLPRSHFDTMLKEIKFPVTTSSTASMRHSISRTCAPGPRVSRVSTCSGKSVQAPAKLYEDIFIPDKEDEMECHPELFPSTVFRRKSSDEEQQKKWLAHSRRLISRNISLKHITHVNKAQSGPKKEHMIK